MKRIFKSFSLIINYKTLIITGLAVCSTYLCVKYGFTAKFPDMLVGVAIVFPVVFSIGSAYTRRETALQRLADFKGHAVALYFAARDWSSDKNHDLHIQVRLIIHEMMHLMKEMFRTGHDSEWVENERKMYVQFSKLSIVTMELRKYGVQSGEISRVSQYVSKIIIAFDLVLSRFPKQLLVNCIDERD